MSFHLCIAQVTEAENVMPGDMVLTGDAGLGVALFTPVKEVLALGLAVVIYFENQQHVTVNADTEVLRLEQGDNSFSDGIGGIQARGADRN